LLGLYNISLSLNAKETEVDFITKDLPAVLIVKSADKCIIICCVALTNTK